MAPKYAKSKHINAVVAAIQRGKFVYYANAAAKYRCDRSALGRRIRGLINSKKDANSFWH
jgi:hypothetical protein